MPLVFIDGLEDYSAWAISASPTIVAGRNGNCVRCPSGSASITYTIPAALESDTVTMGVAMRVPATTGLNSYPNLRSDAAATSHLIVQIQSDGSLAFGRPAANLGVASPPGTIQPNVWTYVEIQAKLHDTTGFMIVRVNGVVVCSAFNVDTKNAGTKTTFDSVRLGSGSGVLGDWDDFYLMTGTGDSFLGDCTVETLYPTADVTAGWVGNDGDSVNNYALVDESGLPAIADYVGASASGTKDLYTLSDLVSTTGTVLAVEHHVYAAKTDTGAIQFQIVNNRTTDNLSAAISPTTSYADYAYHLDTDPEGGAWTIANVNALRAGVKIV